MTDDIAYIADNAAALGLSLEQYDVIDTLNFVNHWPNEILDAFNALFSAHEDFSNIHVTYDGVELTTSSGVKLTVGKSFSYYSGEQTRMVTLRYNQPAESGLSHKGFSTSKDGQECGFALLIITALTSFNKPFSQVAYEIKDDFIEYEAGLMRLDPASRINLQEFSGSTVSDMETVIRQSIKNPRAQCRAEVTLDRSQYKEVQEYCFNHTPQISDFISPQPKEWYSHVNEDFQCMAFAS